MRVLVLGAGGMLGHKLLLRLLGRFEVIGTLRGDGEPYRSSPALAGLRLQLGVAAEDIAGLARTLDDVQPDAVVNCIGLIKQREEAMDPIASIATNALFPHQLARLCGERAIRLLHFSTDCVFSGRKGPYDEHSISDAEDLYGRTKFLGEIARPGCLTIRSSIIGHELAGRLGLLEWFLAQRGGRVRGFARALYSGLTSLAMADLVADLLVHFPEISGVWQVSSHPISKFDLLRMINDVYETRVSIERDDDFACDRRLDSSRFRKYTGFVPAPWRTMIEAMHQEFGLYNGCRRTLGERF